MDNDDDDDDDAAGNDDNENKSLWCVVDMLTTDAEPRVGLQQQRSDLHVCKVCGKRCQLARSLALHMKAHNGTFRGGINRVKPDDTRPTYNCSKCPFRTAFQSSLTRHNRLIHENTVTFTGVTRRKRPEAKETVDCSTDISPTTQNDEPHAQKRDAALPSKLNLEDSNRNLSPAQQSGDDVQLDDIEPEEVMDNEQTEYSQFHSNDQLLVDESTIGINSDNTNKQTKPGAQLDEHVCSVCGKQCKYARTLALHMKVHSSVNHVKASEEQDYISTFSCSKCSFVTSYHSSIVRHVNLVHKRNSLQSTDSAVSVSKPDDDGEKSRETVSSGEVEKSREMSSDEMEKSREMSNVEMEKSREMSSGKVEKSKGVTSDEIEKSRETSSGEVEKSREVSSGKTDKRREVSSDEVEKSREVSSDKVEKSREVSSDDDDDEMEALNVAEESGQDGPVSTHSENSSHCNDCSGDGNAEANVDNICDTETEVPADAESCVANDSVQGVEPKQAFHNGTSLKDCHRDSVDSKSVGYKCNICGKRCQFARSLALHMLAHRGTFPGGKNRVKPGDTRETYNCCKCPFKTVYHTSLSRHYRVMHRNTEANSKRGYKRRNARREFECSKCQFKTFSHKSLIGHDRLMHKSDTEHSVKDIKEQSGSQSPYKLQNEDSVSGVKIDSCDRVASTDAGKDSTEQRHCSGKVEQSSRSKKPICKDHAQKKQDDEQVLQLGDVKVCKRKEFACSECGLMMTYYSAMMRHCQAVHGGGFGVHMKPRHQLLSSERAVISFTANDTDVSAPVCNNQLASNLDTTTAVEASAAVTDKSNVETSTDDSRKSASSSADNSVSQEPITVTVHECDSCHASFNDLSALHSHQCTSSASVQQQQQQVTSDDVVDQSSLQCPTCLKIFTSVEDLHKHLESSSTSECGKSYICQFCGKCFVTSYHLMIHIKQRCGTKLHRCEVCERDFTSFVRLKRHWSFHDGTNPNTCRTCGVQYSGSVAFRRHAKKCRETCGKKRQKQQQRSLVAEPSEKLTKLLTCVVCQKTTDSLAEMHEHKLTHSTHCNSLQSPLTAASSEVFDSKQLLQHDSCLCSVCGKLLFNSDSLKRHILAMHCDTIAAKLHNMSATDEKRFKCSKCHKLFTRPWRHTRCRVKGTRFHCKQCNRQYASVEGLIVHERKHANNNNNKNVVSDKSFICQLCGHHYASLAGLIAHERRHTEKGFVCKFCGRQFNQLGNLQTHTRTHTGEKPYCCKTCGRRFTQLASYQVHMRSHAGDRPFLCSHCAKRFFTSTDLKEHIIVMHTNRKDFQCPVCGWRFALRKAMRRHVKVRHGAQALENNKT